MVNKGKAKKSDKNKDVRNSKPGEEETKVWKMNPRGLYTATAMYKNRKKPQKRVEEEEEGRGWRRKIGGAM